MNKRKHLFLESTLILVLILFFSSLIFANKNDIQPWKNNPYYWQYEGKPILLIGGTDDDNLFQLKDLKAQLSRLKKCGGNYVRNTMSDRDLLYGNVRAFEKVGEKYDLTKWNPLYWEKFKNLLKWSQERNIIVQIEVWDRFDHSRKEWKTDPYNPKNNINYTSKETGLKESYPHHPGSNEQPFFFTVPSLDNNKKVLEIQQKFVDKLLSISLKYDNVLYCIDNETKGKEEWGLYWAKYIQHKAGKRKVYITEMWDVVAMTNKTYDHTEFYDFIDISQNSHQEGYKNWKNAQAVFHLVEPRPCPINSVKIYGSKERSEGVGDQHAVETFFRNLIGGFASSRFHRPSAGLGLSEKSMCCMSIVRKIEKKVSFWDLSPAMNLLADSSLSSGDVYIAKDDRGHYLLYVTNQNKVKLHLNENKSYRIEWIGLGNDKWSKKRTLISSNDISSPYKKNSFAFITIE